MILDNKLIITMLMKGGCWKKLYCWIVRQHSQKKNGWRYFFGKYYTKQTQLINQFVQCRQKKKY